MRLYITRHGQPVKQGRETPYCFVDVELTELGEKQATNLGRRLKQIGFSGKIIASPYRRTAQTANIICGEIGRNFDLCHHIREGDNPEKSEQFKGMNQQQLMREFEHLELKEKLPYPWWPAKCDATETKQEYAARIKPLLDKLLEQENEDVLLVAHAGVPFRCIDNLFAAEIGKFANQMAPYWNCALTAIDLKPQLLPVTLNDVAHLPYEMVTSNSISLKEYEQSA